MLGHSSVSLNNLLGFLKSANLAICPLPDLLEFLILIHCRHRFPAERRGKS